MPRHPDDRLHVAHLPAEVGDRDLALGGQHHVAVPLPRVAGADLGEAPVVEVRQRVHGQLVDGEVLGAGARDREGVRRLASSLLASPAFSAVAASHLGRAVGRPVVDHQHVVARAEQRRQHERQRRRLVLDPEHRGRAGAQALGPGPGPDDVELGVALEVLDPGAAGVGGHRRSRPAILRSPRRTYGRHHRAEAVRAPGRRRARLAGAGAGRPAAWCAARRPPPTSARSPRPPRRGRRTPRAARRARRAPRGCRRRGRRAC